MLIIYILHAEEVFDGMEDEDNKRRMDDETTIESNIVPLMILRMVDDFSYYCLYFWKYINHLLFLFFLDFIGSA